MKAKTIAQCFSLLAILLFVCLVGEFLFAVFTKSIPQSLHKSFPLVTFPALIDKVRSGGEAEEARLNAEIIRVQVTLKNGRKIQGEKVSESPAGIVLKMDGNAVEFSRSEIAKIDYLKEPL